jgi:chaperonin GroEL
VCAVKAPGFGDKRKALLEDLSILTGAALFSEEIDAHLKNATFNDLGKAEKIFITKDKTTIVNGYGNPDNIQKRIAQIDAEIPLHTSPYEKEKLQERKAKLKGGVAVIRIGATSDVELKQKKQIVEDSLNSTRAALEEGIITGGGIALLRAAQEAKLDKNALSDEEMIGAKTVFKACEAPFRQIVENTGYESSLYLEQVLSKPASFGFNVMTEEVEDLILKGVIDPTKVVKNALLNAASVAGIVLLSECLIADAQEEEGS